MRTHWKVTALSLFALALLGPQAHADSVTVKSSVRLDGFNSTNYGTGFTSTDVFDGRHSCDTTNSVDCTATNSYDHPPKNIHEWLCVPNATAYQLTVNCLALVNQNDDGDCHSNDPKDYCAGRQGVGPVCQWRTTSSGTASWSWTVTARSGLPYLVDCSNAGYSGTH